MGPAAILKEGSEQTPAFFSMFSVHQLGVSQQNAAGR